MRILMTTHTVGEGWDFTLDMAHGFAAAGVQTHLATVGPLPTAAQCRAATEVPGLELRAGRFQGEDPSALRREGEWLLQVADRARPDIVQVHHFAHAGLPFGAPVVAAGRRCTYSWWRAVVGEDPPGRYWSLRKAVGRGLHAAAAVVAPTRSFLQGLEDVYAGPFRRGRVICDGARPGVHPAGRKDPFIFASGWLWDPALNLSMLDAVAERVTWPIRLEGSTTPPEGSWEARTRHLDLMGPLPRSARGICMARAGIFCHPAAYDPHGRKVLDAASAGCALVLSDIPAHAELWEGAALLVPPDDPDATAAALQRLIERPDTRQAWALRAEARAAQYRMSSTVQSYLALYRELRFAAVLPGGVRAEGPRLGEGLGGEMDPVR